MPNVVAPPAAEIYSERHHDYVVGKLLQFTAEHSRRSAKPWEELWGVQGYALPRAYGTSRAPAHVPAPPRAPAPEQRSAQAQGSAQGSDQSVALGDKRRAAVKQSNEEDAAQSGWKKQQSTGVTAESSKSQEKAKET